MNLHPTTIRTNIPSRELGAQIVQLRYDLLLEVLMGMVDEVDRQAYHDIELGRKNLSRALYKVRLHLVEAETALNLVVNMCQKYIDDEKKFEKTHFGVTPMAYASTIQRFTSYKLPV